MTVGSGSANSVNIGCDKKICQKTHNQIKISFNKGDFIIRITAKDHVIEFLRLTLNLYAVTYGHLVLTVMPIGEIM